MKPHRNRFVLAMLLTVGIISFFSPSFAKQALNKNRENLKGLKLNHRPKRNIKPRQQTPKRIKAP
jgi:hypothetical protein